MVLVTPTKHSLKSNWVVSSSIHKFNDKGIYWIKLANFSDSIICINKGTKLTNVEEVEGIAMQKETIKILNYLGGNLKHL